jgi:predicted amidohydrolase
MARIAIVQTNPIFGATAHNIRSAVELMESQAADLYILPELFNTGYNFLDLEELERLAEPAEIQSGQTFAALHKFCRSYSSYIVFGFAEKAGRIYNSSALVGPDGLIGLYRKVHLFDRENILFSPGDGGFPVFDLPFGRIGMMICFDWYYPESARTLALKGAQLIAHPANLVLPYCPDAMVTRCLENRVYTATADRVGAEDRGGISLTFIGMSEIVTPKGEIIVRMGAEPGVSVAEIDLRLADMKKINKHNSVLEGRKPDQYR